MSKLALTAEEYRDYILLKKREYLGGKNKNPNSTNYIMSYKPKTRKPIEIPEDWVWMTIDEIASKINSGSTPLGGEAVYQDKGIMFIRSQNVQMQKLDISNIAYISEEIHQEMANTHVKYGDILLNITGASIGRTTWFNFKNTEANVNQHVSIIRLVEDIPEWITYCLSTHWGQKQIMDYQSGSTRQGLNIDAQKQLMFPLPPSKEIKKVIFFLNNVDAIITKTQELIDRLQVLKRGLMQKIFTEGIGHTEFKDIKRWGKIPKDWKIENLGKLATLKNGINFDKNTVGSGILTVDVLNMYSNTIYIDITNLYRVNKVILEDSFLKENDILFVRSSLKQEGVGWPSLFKGADEKVSFCGFIIRARLITDKIDPEFLLYFLRSHNSRKQLLNLSGKVAITNISQDSLKFLKIIIPDNSEQKIIVNYLKNIDTRIILESEYINILKSIKKGLMQVLLTGKKRVPL